jgi:hypothetical protein
MKKLIAIMMFLIIHTISAQETKKENETLKTKMDAFTSKTGALIKFTDTELAGIKDLYTGLTKTKIRKINSSNLTGYFFQIEKGSKYGSSVASIEYTDLLEIIKALQTLKKDVDKDLVSSPYYLENKFTTTDGFQIGYYISKGKVTWYIKLEKFGSDNTLFIENNEIIETSFNEAKNKIEELRK